LPSGSFHGVASAPKEVATSGAESIISQEANPAATDAEYRYQGLPIFRHHRTIGAPTTGSRQNAQHFLQAEGGKSLPAKWRRRVGLIEIHFTVCKRVLALEIIDPRVVRRDPKAVDDAFAGQGHPALMPGPEPSLNLTNSELLVKCHVLGSFIFSERAELKRKGRLARLGQLGRRKLENLEAAIDDFPQDFEP
jgi:hypothetical protein